ncbi:hypothetical protein C7T35_30705 [Variovorax sp. WS11]|uniref:hypothetical protein n=1 Tax=Variovorax sp. WS11 TaxID=1105204 RepID=UPI000D0CED6C|nr:hypothetical protein [Variovorax sp. WS11]NDZ13009.1 hypothetical protein [Variovorax sp. WS11]PSL80740.1 hypothetical protein C7T35_30705 [Variovorax sp. WS11]
MPAKFLATIALAFIGSVHAAPPPASPLIPLGVSGTGDSSVAWMLDAARNRILVCRVEYGSGGGSSCNVIQLPAR